LDVKWIILEFHAFAVLAVNLQLHEHNVSLLNDVDVGHFVTRSVRHLKLGRVLTCARLQIPLVVGGHGLFFSAQVWVKSPAGDTQPKQKFRSMREI
jgi:hypothetical protein